MPGLSRGLAALFSAALIFVPAGGPCFAACQQGILAGEGPSPALGVPPAPIPADNPMSPEKIELGRLLFFEGRLSRDGTVSCATCHKPELAYTDGRPAAVGIRGQKGLRNTPTLLNTAYNLSQFWDGRAPSLEAQALHPIANPLEMGFTLAEAVARLNGIAGYRQRFRKVFGTEATAEGIGKAVAAFERTLVSGDSPWDRHNLGDIEALSSEAKRGIVVFRTKGRCVLCHVGPTFTDNDFHNLGAGVEQGNRDPGRFKVTGEPSRQRAFKTPSLRNVAQTAPYMHDGSLKTLAEVVDFYDKGGFDNPGRDPRMFPRNLTDGEKKDLVAFLESLSGSYPRIEPPELPE
ncbi:MAG: cytochrome-c peroxidase [Planctomycetota bacterium]